MKKILGTLIMTCLLLTIVGQPLQTIRGRVTDKESKIPLPGVNIILLNTDPLVGATSDAEGIFRIDNVPVGRQSIKVSCVGAKACLKPDTSNRPERKHARNLIHPIARSENTPETQFILSLGAKVCLKPDSSNRPERKHA